MWVWRLLLLFFQFWGSVFVATWNVAGRSPPSNLSLDDWLHASPPADIYVLGYDLVLFMFAFPYQTLQINHY